MGPVSVEIPIDIQLHEIDRPDALERLTRPIPPAIVPSERALDALAGMVRASKRPVL